MRHALFRLLIRAAIRLLTYARRMDPTFTGRPT